MIKIVLTRALLIIAVLTSCATGVWSQKKQTIDQQLETKLKQLIANIVAIKNSAASDADKETQTRNEFFAGTHLDLYAFALVKAVKPRDAFVRTIEEARVDKQVGGEGANSGSTSLVSKGSTPAILGFAVENGALQKEVSGTTITFRGNPVGIIKALGDKGFIESYDDDDSTTSFLRRLSFAASFDSNRGNQPGTFTGSQQQLSSYSFRFDIINKRDPRNWSYRNKWANLITNQGQAITETSTALLAYFNPRDAKAIANPALQTWHDSAEKAILKASANDVDSVIREQLDTKLRLLALPDDVRTLIDTYERTVNSYLADRGNLLKEVANGPIVTFEFTNNRPGNQLQYSNFNLIGEFSPFQGRADLTTNASFSIFDKKPTGPNGKTARDFQLSGQLDVPLGDIAKTGPFVFTMSGKYQHLFSDITTTGTTPTTAKKGNIGIGQFKFTIPVKGSGVKIPLSVTFSNRSELVKESRVRGNIGITFDLDSIFSKLKP
jgi:hypothetical protein